MTRMLAKSETIRAWTVQPWAVWEKVEAQGSLTVDPQYTAKLHHSYEWLRDQLLRPVPGYAGHYVDRNAYYAEISGLLRSRFRLT